MLDDFAFVVGGKPAKNTDGLFCAWPGGAMDQGRQAGDPLDAAVVPSFPGERSAPSTERPGLQPGQFVAQTRPARHDQALVADKSPAAAGEDGGPSVKHARYYWLLLAEGHLNRRLFGGCCGGSGRCGAGRLTRGQVQRRLATKGHKCGAVSEKCPESSGSGRFHVSVG